MHPVVVAQFSFGMIAVAALVMLIRNAEPEPDEEVRYAWVFSLLVASFISVTTVPLVALALWGDETTARVVRLKCPDRDKHYVTYEFTVGSLRYEGSAGDQIDPKACSTRSVGDEDKVVYLPSRPSINAWRSPVPQLEFNLLVSVGAAIAFPSMTWWRARRRSAA